MLFSFLFAYVGFALLSMSKNHHYQQVWPDQKLVDITVKIFTTLGWVLLACSSLYLFQVEKVSVALTELIGILSIAALLLILQFAYLPRSVAGAALIDSSKKFLYRFAVAKK